MRLSDEQVEVLAALDRTGPCTLRELASELPALAPGAILKLLQRLGGRGYVSIDVDDEAFHLSAVTFHPAAGRIDRLPPAGDPDDAF